MGSRRRAGFTLIEILIALAMVAIILGAVYGTYASARQSVHRCRGAHAAQQQARILLATMARELRCAHVRPREAEPVEDDAEDSAPAVSGMEVVGPEDLPVRFTSGSGEILRVLTAGAARGPGDSPAGLSWVAYRLDGSAGTLHRLQYPAALGEEPPPWRAGWVPVAREIESVEFEYYDGEEWLAEWSPLGGADLPVAVRISVALGQRETGNRSFSTAAQLGCMVRKPEEEIIERAEAKVRPTRGEGEGRR